jgi:hypothetical protein
VGDGVTKGADRIVGEKSTAPFRRAARKELPEFAETRFSKVHEANIVLDDDLSTNHGRWSGCRVHVVHEALKGDEFVESVGEPNRMAFAKPELDLLVKCCDLSRDRGSEFTRDTGLEPKLVDEPIRPGSKLVKYSKI